MAATATKSELVQSRTKAPGEWKWERITPSRAKFLLENMATNRKINRKACERLVQAIESGHYRITHQGIAINRSGQLCDGQHRLEAIIRTNIPLDMWVYHGLEDDAMLVIDTGKNRSDADALNIAGLTTDNRSVAIARIMAGCGYSREMPRDELREFIEMHMDAIVFANKLFPTAIKGLVNATTMAPVARAYYTQDRQRLTEFANVLKTGIVTDPKQDGAAVHLHRLLMSGASRGRSWSNKADTYRKTESALKLFLERRSMVKLYACAEEQFPIPGEPEFDCA